MTRPAPLFDDLERGEGVLVPDPFKPDDDATRPWVVANTEDHPFGKQRDVVMGLTARTWYGERVSLDETDYRHRKARGVVRSFHTQLPHSNRRR